MHQIYAQIDGDGIVQNISIFNNYEDANRITRAVYGDAAIAVEVSRWAVTIGCKYIDGKFYESDGTTPCEYIPSDRELAEEAKRMTAVNERKIAYTRMLVDEVIQLINSNVGWTTPPVFSKDSQVVDLYLSKYFDADNAIEVVPDIGNLRTVVSTYFDELAV